MVKKIHYKLIHNLDSLVSKNVKKSAMKLVYLILTHPPLFKDRDVKTNRKRYLWSWKHLNITMPSMMRKHIPTTIANGSKYVLMSKGSSSVKISRKSGCSTYIKWLISIIALLWPMKTDGIRESSSPPIWMTWNWLKR